MGFEAVCKMLYAVPYAAFVSLLGFSAWSLSQLLCSQLQAYEVMWIGFAVILMSFAAQLLGHAHFEQFEAPPHLWHGFVAAPILEYVSLLFRHGAMPALYDELLQEVLEVSKAATALRALVSR